MIEESITNIDIGGGKDAVFFRNLASLYPEQTFLVLDPFISKNSASEISKENIPNLHLVKWGIESLRGNDGKTKFVEIPVRDKKINHAYLNLIFDPLSVDTLPSDINTNYQALASTLSRVLAENGQIHITEPSSHIESVLNIFSTQGFSLSTEVNDVIDNNKTPSTKIYLDKILPAAKALDPSGNHRLVEFTLTRNATNS